MAVRLSLFAALVAFCTNTTVSFGQEPRPAATAKRDIVEVLSPPENIVATTRFTWATSLSPDEKYVAVGYGHWAASEAGQVRVWEVGTGNPRWSAPESRGVRAVSFSPDGSLVASGNFGGQIHLRDAATGELKQELRESGGSVERLDFSSDGKRLATSSNTSKIARIWDLSTGQIVQSFPGHAEVVYWVEFSPDDKLIATASKDATVRIWNVADAKLLHTLPHGGEVSAAVFVSGGKQLATVCHDGEARIWNVETGKLDLTLPVPQPRNAAIAIGLSQNGKYLATGNQAQINLWLTSDWSHIGMLTGSQQHAWGASITNDGSTLVSSAWDDVVRVWDVPNQAEIRSMPLPTDERSPAGPVRTLSVSPDGKTIAVSCAGNTVLLRERATGKIVRTLEGAESEILAVAYSPDGRVIAAVGLDQRGLVWDAKSGELVGKTGGHEGGASCLAWSADSRIFATGGNDNMVRVWDGKSQRELATLEGHLSTVRAVVLSPDGSRAISGGDDPTLIVWDVSKRAPSGTLEGHIGPVFAIAISPDGATAASGGEDKSIKVWDLVSLKLRSSIGGHSNPVRALAFSPGGQTLASSSTSGGFQLNDPIRGAVRKGFPNVHTGSVNGLTFLSDGSGLVTAGDDQTIRFWKAAPPPIEPLVTIEQGPEVFSSAYSPDGKYLATGGKDGLVHLRDPVTGAIRRTLKGHNGIIYEIVFPPDAAVCATAGSDGTVRLWSVERGVELAKFNAWKDKHASARAIEFDPAGKLLVSGCGDGTLRIWDIDNRKLKQSLVGQALPVTSIRYSPDGSLLATSTGDWQKWQLPGELRLWNGKTSEEIASLPGHANEIKRVDFTPSGDRLVSAAAGGWVFVWDVASHKPVSQFKADAAPTALCVLPDGVRAAIGDNKGGLAIWDLTSGKTLARYAGHTKIIPNVAVSRDGKRLASVSQDGTVKIWKVE